MALYPVAFADAAGVIDVARPRQAERSAVEIAVREHVRQAERVIVVFRQQLQERLHAVVAGEPSRTHHHNYNTPTHLYFHAACELSMALVRRCCWGQNSYRSFETK